jgi:peptidoglycan/LPS O-acetylase OafA/YrhL
MVSTHLLGYEYANRYNALFAGGLPFSIGACLFHYHARLISTLKKLLVPRSLFIITVVFILNFIFINVFKKMDMNFMFYLSFYLNYIITAAFILHFSVAKASPSVRKLDKIFGDFSYPTYLLHWQIAFLVSMLVFNVPITGLNIDGVSVFILTIPVTFLVSYGLSVVVDRPVEILRLKVKSKINTRALKGGGENVTV